MEILLKRFECDFCQGTSEIELGVTSLEIDPDSIQFNIVKNEHGSFCDEACESLFLEEKYEGEHETV